MRKINQTHTHTINLNLSQLHRYFVQLYDLTSLLRCQSKLRLSLQGEVNAFTWIYKINRIYTHYDTYDYIFRYEYSSYSRTHWFYENTHIHSYLISLHVNFGKCIIAPKTSFKCDSYMNCFFISTGYGSTFIWPSTITWVVTILMMNTPKL